MGGSDTCSKQKQVGWMCLFSTLDTHTFRESHVSLARKPRKTGNRVQGMRLCSSHCISMALHPETSLESSPLIQKLIQKQWHFRNCFPPQATDYTNCFAPRRCPCFQPTEDQSMNLASRASVDQNTSFHRNFEVCAFHVSFSTNSVLLPK